MSQGKRNDGTGNPFPEGATEIKGVTLDGATGPTAIASRPPPRPTGPVPLPAPEDPMRHQPTMIQPPAAPSLMEGGATVLKPRTTPPAPPPAAARPPTEPNVLVDSGATVLKPGRGAPTGNAAPSLASQPAPAPAKKPTTLAPPESPAARASNSVAPPAAPAAKPTPKKGMKAGDRVGHYELIRLLGKGGMGSVYLARDTKLGRRVAIKFLHTSNAEIAKRFVLEARATARCAHDNIVVIYEADEFDGMPYMALEYLQGVPLTKLITGQPMPSGRAVELMVPVVRALARAHEEGIAHRDLKPDNVFVTESGTVKVLDFGIAKVLRDDEGGVDASLEAQANAAAASHQADAENQTVNIDEGITDLTHHGAIMGTLAFMSPEQWRGAGIDHRTDIWATGIMLFGMLSGKHPLDGLTGMALSITAKLDHLMPSLRERAPNLPPGLCEVVDKCLLKKKEDRFPDAVSLLRALEPFAGTRGGTARLKADESPYAGLSSFQESDADRFFGRTHEIAAIVNRLRDQPLLGVVGASGSGKSSIVRAGVVPGLKRSGEDWDALVIRPGRDPLAALANVVTSMVGTSTSVADDIQEQAKLVERLRNEPGYLGSVLRARARQGKKNILVFVDQFEELYTLVQDAKERLAFTSCLAAVADDATSPTRVILSIRSDFIDRAAEDPRFMAELSQGLFFLAPPNQDGLREALVSPAEMAGYRFESDAIVSDMLQHLAATQGALPLLQFCASKLWDSRDAAKKQLTQASYQSIGGIAGALASHADSVLAELPPSSRTLVRSLFLRLVTPDRTRAIVSLDELDELTKDKGELRKLLDQLVRARLLVVNTAGGGATAEIVHESLIHSWPQLKRWLEETGEDAAFLDQLRQASRQWAQKGKDSGLLWRGEMVEEAERFARRNRETLPEQQQAFLAAVFANDKKAARLKRVAAYGGITFLVLLVAAAGVALVVIREAQVEAVAAAGIARSAEAEAKKNLDAAVEKEKARAAAEKRAQDKAAEVLQANATIEEKAVALEAALTRSELLKEEAKSAQGIAELNAVKARKAESDALKAAKDLQSALAREQTRREALEAQLGSRAIDTLK